MNTSQKLDILKDVSGDDATLDRILEKLIETALSDLRLHQKRHEHALIAFEQRYEMDSETFYRRFEAGELGDAMDFFEWASLFELQEDLKQKIHRLEHAL